MKTIMCCLALVALTAFPSAGFAQEATLTSVEAKFDTTTDNKDQQTNRRTTRNFWKTWPRN